MCRLFVVFHFGALVIRFGGRHVCAISRCGVRCVAFCQSLSLSQVSMGHGPGQAAIATWAGQAESGASSQEGSGCEAMLWRSSTPEYRRNVPEDLQAKEGA